MMHLSIILPRNFVRPKSCELNHVFYCNFNITSCVWQKLYHTIIGHVKGIQNSGSSTRTSAEVLAFI
ncbi:hypothetical protein T12_4105 [Trichinella patagoniensis]|uniref:Uncharacterized protein n=1 Tax=Trichinella patagoniensis TaxID=990121 RepID=A0A0V0ZUZ8_9BILA|nr:hypothetical protein T12_4105 [Trichinella patagoniensis]